ncbi:juvenile hormone acid O-methyltransferase-like [Tachypleus tridentatus]|uniref:juvenile hormone acid O-methyltransferase-like n=1 Tax=Tachypleus tridentatus TaxID=6853 RepID=UPI003FD0050A
MNTKPFQFYSNRPEENLEWTNSKLSYYVSKMSGSNWDTVLDFGCGPGDVTKNILLKHCPNFTKIIAIDVQPTFVEFAKKTFGHERIDYLVLDITEKTPAQWREMFDKVFAFFSLHYVGDFKKFLNILHDVLKPGGYFLSLGIASAPAFSVWLEMSMTEEWKQYFIGIEKYIPVTHAIKNYCDQFRQLAEECGFVPIAITSSLESVTFDSEKQLVDFHECVLPEEIVKQLPLEMFDKFLDDYRKAFRKDEITYNADGTISVQHTILEIFLQSKNSAS